ncbi:MAG: ABC transporter ATP-binding protein [Fervidicoccaceae archaeon]
MPPEILETVGLTKRFGGLVALDNVDVKVLRRTLTLLIGPNGAGKTTLVNVCTGVLKPDAGKVYFSPLDDERLDITGWPSHKIYSAGLVRTFQIPRPFLSLTVLENVLVAMGGNEEGPLKALFRRLWIRQEEERIKRAFDVLRLVGLEGVWNVQALKLGAGHLKMLEVARALAAGAKLVVLDEPIGGTDPAYAVGIFEKLRSLREKIDVSFLIIEHRIDVALRYSDYVYVMDRGRILSEGSPEKVVNDSRVIEVYLSG